MQPKTVIFEGAARRGKFQEIWKFRQNRKPASSMNFKGSLRSFRFVAIGCQAPDCYGWVKNSRPAGTKDSALVHQVVNPDLRSGPGTRGVRQRADSARRLHSRGHNKTQHTKQERHDAPRHTQSEPLTFRSGAFPPSHLIAAAILCWVFSPSFEISREQVPLDNFRKRGPLTRCGCFPVFP